MRNEVSTLKSDKIFEDIFESLPDSCAIVNEEGIIEEVNEAFCDWTGYSRDEVVGKSYTELTGLLSKESIEEISEHARALLEGEEIPFFTVKYIPKGQRPRYSEINSVLIENDSGPDKAVALFRDITKRKRIEEVLEERTSKLEILNNLLRQDLGNKYQIIAGYLELLREVDLPEEHEEYLEVALENAKKGNKIIDQAKELREIDEVDRISEKGIVKVVKDAVEEVKTSPEADDIDIEVEYKEGLDRVRGDYSLKKLFSFIVEARMETPECDKIRISVEEGNGDIVVRLEDNGEKPPEDVKSLIYGSPYTGRTSGIAGFRYYVIGEIVSHNEGRIEFQESEMGGARFDVYLKRV